VHLNFPSLEEQEKIANTLFLIDERITTQKKVIEKLQSLIGGIIEREFRQKGNVKCIGDIIEQTTLRNRNRLEAEVLSVSNKFGFIEQNEQFEDRTIASSDTSNYKIVKLNDFAYNPARINVGSIARLSTFNLGIVSPMYICFHANEFVCPEYLELFFKTKYFQTEIEKRLEGSVRLCLSYDGLCEIPIALPTIDYQKFIVGKLQLLINKLNVEERYANTLVKQKKALLSTMFI
jgi:type I restriction enzyme S subunit